MKIDEKEVDRIEQIWRNDFALLYKDKPRLYNVIKLCRLDIGEEEIEPGIKMLFIVFYVQNSVQCEWVEKNLLFEMQERCAQMAELDNLTLGVDVDGTQDFRIIETTEHKPVVLTDIDNRKFD